MDHYSFDVKGEDFVFARAHDINASYKDLGAVCAAVRYLKVSSALAVLDAVISKDHAIPYLRHNKHMGSRHELGGSKGGYPVKAAREVRKVIVNAAANAWNTGRPSEDMVIVGACANKTRIERRYPSKGSLAWGRGMYGMSAMNHSDLEYAKIEIVLADDMSQNITKNMKYFIRKKASEVKVAKASKAAAKQQAKPAAAAQKASKPAGLAAAHNKQPAQPAQKEQPKAAQENKSIDKGASSGSLNM